METSVNCEGAEDLKRENSVLSVIYLLLTSFVFSSLLPIIFCPFFLSPFPFVLSRFSPIRTRLN